MRQKLLPSCRLSEFTRKTSFLFLKIKRSIFSVAKVEPNCFLLSSRNYKCSKYYASIFSLDNWRSWIDFAGRVTRYVMWNKFRTLHRFALIFYIAFCGREFRKLMMSKISRKYMFSLSWLSSQQPINQKRRAAHTFYRFIYWIYINECCSLRIRCIFNSFFANNW